MISKTITYALMTVEDIGFTTSMDELGLPEDRAMPLLEYLTSLVSHQQTLIDRDVRSITIHHHVFYEGQCNTEFSPPVISLLQQLQATLCLSAQQLSETLSCSGFYDLLQRIRQRPAMWIGGGGITALYHFINGYFMACDSQSWETPNFDGFHDFVGRYYGTYGTAGWKSLILAAHYGNEEEALVAFYRHLDRYLAWPDRPSARHIIFRLLNHQVTQRPAQINTLLNEDFFQDLASNRTALDFEDLLQNIFEQINDDAESYQWLKQIPKVERYGFEIWDNDTSTTLLRSEDGGQDLIKATGARLIKTFLAIDQAKALEIKERYSS
jgi:hypothetical protein